MIAIAYVNGSYDDDTKLYSYGVVIVKDGENEELYGSGFDGDGVRNIAGEIEGATKAVEYAMKNGFDSVHICYGYEGIEAWATRLWKAKKPVTKSYLSFMDAARQKVEITFEKVKATGSIYHLQAAALAKRGIAEAAAMYSSVNKAEESAPAPATVSVSEKVEDGLPWGDDPTETDNTPPWEEKPAFYTGVAATEGQPVIKCERDTAKTNGLAFGTAGEGRGFHATAHTLDELEKATQGRNYRVKAAVAEEVDAFLGKYVNFDEKADALTELMLIIEKAAAFAAEGSE